MLKFQQNRTRPELIKILFMTSLKRQWKTENWNENIFHELFLGDLNEKITSAGYKRERNKKESETVRRANN